MSAVTSSRPSESDLKAVCLPYRIISPRRHLFLLNLQSTSFFLSFCTFASRDSRKLSSLISPQAIFGNETITFLIATKEIIAESFKEEIFLCCLLEDEYCLRLEKWSSESEGNAASSTDEQQLIR